MRGRGAVTRSTAYVPTRTGLMRFSLSGEGRLLGEDPWPEDVRPGNVLPLPRVLVVAHRVRLSLHDRIALGLEDGRVLLERLPAHVDLDLEALGVPFRPRLSERVDVDDRHQIVELANSRQRCGFPNASFGALAPLLISVFFASACYDRDYVGRPYTSSPALAGANAAGLFYLAMRKGLDYLWDHPNADRARLGVTGFSNLGNEPVGVNGEGVGGRAELEPFRQSSQHLNRGFDVDVARVGWQRHARPDLPVHLDWNLDLLRPCGRGIDLGPPRRRGATGMTEPFPQLFGDVRREWRQQQHERLDRLAGARAGAAPPSSPPSSGARSTARDAGRAARAGV